MLILTASQIIYANPTDFTYYEKQIDKCHGARDMASSIFCFDELNAKLDHQVEQKYKYLVDWVENEKNKQEKYYLDEYYLDEYGHKITLSQRAWEVYININCDAVTIPFSQGIGSPALLNGYACSATEKINRLKALNEYYPR